MPRAKKTTAVIEEVSELPVELKEELNALVPTVEPEVNETFLKLQDNLNNVLAKAEEELKRIDERAEYAISVVSQAIRTRAAVEKGRLLLEIKTKYQNVPEFEGRFCEWYKLAGYTPQTVSRLINAAKVVDDAAPIFGEEMLMNIPVTALHSINKLPTESKLDVLEKVEAGEKVSAKEVEQIAAMPEVKLTKAQELLAEARARRQELTEEYEAVKNNPELDSKSEEWAQMRSLVASNKKTIENLEIQVEEFRLMARQSKSQAEAEAKARASAEAELESLKFDDDAARQQRVKRIQSTLTVQIPQVMGDIQKYRAERDHYDEEYRIALDTLIKDLQSYLSEYSV